MKTKPIIAMMTLGAGWIFTFAIAADQIAERNREIAKLRKVTQVYADGLKKIEKRAEEMGVLSDRMGDKLKELEAKERVRVISQMQSLVEQMEAEVAAGRQTP